MRFEIARERDDAPIKILPLLDVPILGELQGRNGIGKSLSIKLLQLLTGSQPWTARSEHEAWRTLRERLGPTSVTVSGLEGAKIVEWDLTPAAWPETPPTDVADLFAVTPHGTGIEARIDESPADLQQIRQVLVVHRLVGDETLEDSVRVQIGQMETRTTNEAASIGDVVDNVREILVDAVETLEPLSGRSVRRLETHLKALAETQRGLAEKREASQERLSRLTALENRSRTLRRLEELQAQNESSDLGARVATLDQQINEVRADRDGRFEAAIADVQLRQRIQDARAEVERVEALLARAEEDAREKAAEAFLVDKTSELDADSVAAVHDEVAQEIVRLREAQASQDAVPLVSKAATTVKRALDRVDPASLLEHPFAVLDGRDVSGRELADGVDAELRVLAGAARDPSGAQLETELNAATERLAAIVELERAAARQRRHTTALRNRRKELLDLTGQADGDASERYTELEKQLASLEDQRRTLQGSHFRYAILVEELAPGEDLPRARARLLRDLRAAGVVADEDLPDTRTATETVLRELDFDLREIGVGIDEASRSLESARERRSLGAEALEHSPLVEALKLKGVVVPASTDAKAIEQLAEDLLRAAEQVVERLDVLRRESEGLAGAFRFLDAGEVDQDMSRIDRVRAAAEHRIVEALNQPVLQQELFDRGAVEGYDNRRKTVTFRPAGSSASVTRSLSAFSSGERVFAYTQMRLRAIAESPAACSNRLVVLDEFGAFLESRRVRALEGLVEDELLGHGIDRVLFILPLTANQQTNQHGYVVLDRSSS